MRKLNCPHCGTSALATMRLCPACLKPLSAATGTAAAIPVSTLPSAPVSSGASPAPAAAPAAAPFQPTGAWSGAAPVPAGLWRRALSLVLDLLLLSPLAAVSMWLVPGLGGLLSSWVYFAAFESSAWQGTPGKRLLKLKVLDANGVPLRFGRATLRFVYRFLSALPLGLGYLMALFNPNRQTLHDLLASTRVVTR